MKKIVLLLAAGLIAIGTKAHGQEIVVDLLGDSTVKLYAEKNPKRGWGQYLGLYFDNRIKIINRAVLGKSSKSYQSSSQWTEANRDGADYWFIQFGHNDSNRGAHRHTDPAVEFPRNLRILIAAARKSGAKPVLVTPPPRRLYQADGTLTVELDPYVEAMKRVGADDCVPVLDLNAHAKALLQKLGDQGSADLNAPGDRTHFSEKGARLMARYVAQEVRIRIPELSSHVVLEDEKKP